MRQQENSATSTRSGAGSPSHLEEHFDLANWSILIDEPGRLRVEVPVLPRLRNPRGQLFGGYTPAYADIMAFRVARGMNGNVADPSTWYATTGMRVDYLEAIVADSFEIECTMLRARGRNRITETSFFQDGQLAAFAVTTLLVIERPI